MAGEIKYTGYELSRAWFDFCFENSDIVAPIHTALYFFCIEHCNRLGWKEKFGLPTQMTMDAIGVKNWRTYKRAFDDIVSWGFIKVHQLSKNQYSATVIGIVKNTKAPTKALSKAIQKHGQKQSRSIAVIDKPINQEPITNKPSNKKDKKEFDFSFCDVEFLPVLTDWLDYRKKINKPFEVQESIEGQYRKILKLSGNDVKIAALVVEQTISEGWQGLFALKDEYRPQSEVQLGTDERIENGRRTYGTGKITIPMDAPPRPGAQYSWNEKTKSWITL